MICDCGPTLFLVADATCQPNLCDSELHAVDHANTKFSTRYKATGVGSVICAWNSLVRKNGLGDLQKGERQVPAFDSGVAMQY